jgi:hypothetical protein
MPFPTLWTLDSGYFWLSEPSHLNSPWQLSYSPFCPLFFSFKSLYLKFFFEPWNCTHMDGGGQYNPRTVEEVFRDFKGRRAGMIKALTTGLALALWINSLLFSIFILSECLGFRYEFPHSANCNGSDFFFFFFFWFLCDFVDVEEFYQQCDPG